MHNLANKTPEELMKLYVDGHPDEAVIAFEELYHRYSHRVYLYCLKRLNLKSDAEDVLQKIFLKLHESKHLYDGKYKFEQWIFVIAKSSVIDAFRKRARDVKNIEALLAHKEVSLPLAEEEKRDLEILDGINPKEQKLMELKYIDELSYKEISELMNKSEVSLRKMISRIVVKLKNGGVS